jgi:hypothetical protein
VKGSQTERYLYPYLYLFRQIGIGANVLMMEDNWTEIADGGV